MIYRTICVLAVWLMLPLATLTAQTPSRAGGATIRGTVKDNTGAIIPQATVTLTDQNGATQTTQTKDDGTYVFRSVKPGTYTVSAEAKNLTQDGVVAVEVARVGFEGSRPRLEIFVRGRNGASRSIEHEVGAAPPLCRETCDQLRWGQRGQVEHDTGSYLETELVSKAGAHGPWPNGRPLGGPKFFLR